MGKRVGKALHAKAPNKLDVLDGLLCSHETYFDVSRGYEFAGRSFAGYAEFRSHSEQFVLVKRAKLWEADAFEYIFFDVVDHADVAYVDEAIHFMTTEALAKVVPDENHMTSFISLVVIADSADSEAIARIKKARFRKNFKLGLRGWADLRVALTDLSSMEVVTNSMGKEMKSTLLSCLKTATFAHDSKLVPSTDSAVMMSGSEDKKGVVLA